jgi:DNA repair protein RadC
MQRLKEQLQTYGVETLSTSELLAFVLSSVSTPKDMVPIASKLLEKYGERDLKNRSETDLANEGLTRTRAQLLKVVCELAVRLSLPEPQERPQIATADDAIGLLRPFLSYLDREAFRVLVLDGKNRLLANIQVYKGSANSSVVRPSEVFREAIVRNGLAIVVAHNHPSLDPAPSLEDYEVTRHLVDAGKLLGIEVVDHLIIGHPEYVSMKGRMTW